MQGNEPTQRTEAQKLMVRAQLAIEQSIPRGVQYVVVLVGPGFNTYGANVDKVTAAELCRALAGELQRDVTHGSR